MNTKRQNSIRLAQKETTIFRSVSQIFHSLHLYVPKIISLTIVKVSLSPDLSVAKIFLYAPEGKSFVDEIIQQILPYVPSMRKSLSNLVELRKTPKLYMVYDAQYEKQVKIEQLRDKANA